MAWVVFCTWMKIILCIASLICDQASLNSESTILKKLFPTSTDSLTMHTVHISFMPHHQSVAKSANQSYSPYGHGVEKEKTLFPPLTQQPLIPGISSAARPSCWLLHLHFASRKHRSYPFNLSSWCVVLFSFPLSPHHKHTRNGWWHASNLPSSIPVEGFYCPSPSGDRTNWSRPGFGVSSPLPLQLCATADACWRIHPLLVRLHPPELKPPPWLIWIPMWAERDRSAAIAAAAALLCNCIFFFPSLVTRSNNTSPSTTGGISSSPPPPLWWRGTGRGCGLAGAASRRRQRTIPPQPSGDGASSTVLAVIGIRPWGGVWDPVCKKKAMLRIRWWRFGTFSPRQEPLYTYKAEEYTTPSASFARGSCSAK